MMRFTTQRSLVRIAMGAVPLQDWVYHPSGSLTATLAEQVRVSVWHPELTRPDIAEIGGAVHDLTCDVETSVLVGSLVERWFGDLVKDDAHGLWRVWRKEGDVLTPTSGRVRANVATTTYKSPETFVHARGVFHVNLPTGLAVTVGVLSRHDAEAHPRFLLPFEMEPTVKHKPISAAVRSRLIEAAKEALG
jgi:hypothetical protein